MRQNFYEIQYFNKALIAMESILCFLKKGFTNSCLKKKKTLWQRKVKFLVCNDSCLTLLSK